MTIKNDKPVWWSISKLEIVEPDNNPVCIFSNGRNRVTISIRIVPITSDYKIIKQEDLSDDEIKRNIYLIDEIDESELPFNEDLEWTTERVRWGYTDNVNPDDPKNRFANTPNIIRGKRSNMALPFDRANDGARIIKFNVYCKVNGGALPKKKIAIKVCPHSGEIVTSLNGPTATGSAYVHLLTILDEDYKDDDIRSHYYDFKNLGNACNDDNSFYRIIELSLKKSNHKLVASKIFNNQKDKDDIVFLKKYFFDNENEFPWIHRAAVLKGGAYSYYCWGFDYIPVEANISLNSKDDPYALGRGQSYCYVKISDIFKNYQKRFLIIIIWQKKSGLDNEQVLDKPINVRLYDQFGTKGDFQLTFGEDYHVENQKTSAGIKLSSVNIHSE